MGNLGHWKGGLSKTVEHAAKYLAGCTVSKVT